MKLLPYLALLCQSGALFTRPPIERLYDVVVTPLTSTTELSTILTLPTALSQATVSGTITISHSTLITMAPLSRNPLEVRQRCFDDRGFSVGCNTWTGYFYSWGPSGDPYNDGSGSSGNSISNYSSHASQTIMPLAISYVVLVNVLTLWAALSLS